MGVLKIPCLVEVVSSDQIIFDRNKLSPHCVLNGIFFTLLLNPPFPSRSIYGCNCSNTFSASEPLKSCCDCEPTWNALTCDILEPRKAINFH